MTLDGAIKHAETVAEEHTKYNIYGGFESCDECATDHRQLAEWLKELKRLKEQEPCEDAIDRQAVEDAIAEMTVNGESLGYAVAYDILSDLPSVTPQPKMGRWIDDEFGSKCSCCGIYTHLDKFDRPMKFKCCSMCGAKMIEPQESEDKE